MQGVRHEAVVLHYECPAMKKMQSHRIACKVKKMAIKIKYLKRKIVSTVIFEIIVHIAENKLIIKT